MHQKKKSSSKIVVALGVIILVFLCAVIVLIIHNSNSKEKADTLADQIEVTEPIAYEPTSTVKPTEIITPTPSATPEPTPEPTPEYTGPVVTITKNPTSEALSIGGKTWFIAHADNANDILWLCVNTSGEEKSLDEAMSDNPGLSLEALEGDTLAVTNVPVSFNGWGIIAQFSNEGSTAKTDTAYIYVGDFLNAYSSIIQKYKNAYSVSDRKGQTAVDYKVSEFICYSNSAGYALKDIDKNGVPELIIAAYSSDDEFSDKVVFELCTLDNGKPVQLVQSWARSKFYLTTDNRILWIGSGGAAFTSIDIFKVNGNTLNFVEGYQTYNETESSGLNLYHTTIVSNNNNLTFYNGDGYDGGGYAGGNYDAYDSVSSSEGLAETRDNLLSHCWIPPLTKIS